MIVNTQGFRLRKGWVARCPAQRLGPGSEGGVRRPSEAALRMGGGSGVQASRLATTGTHAGMHSWSHLTRAGDPWLSESRCAVRDNNP